MWLLGGDECIYIVDEVGVRMWTPDIDEISDKILSYGKNRWKSIYNETAQFLFDVPKDTCDISYVYDVFAT